MLLHLERDDNCDQLMSSYSSCKWSIHLRFWPYWQTGRCWSRLIIGPFQVQPLCLKLHHTIWSACNCCTPTELGCWTFCVLDLSLEDFASCPGTDTESLGCSGSTWLFISTEGLDRWYCWEVVDGKVCPCMSDFGFIVGTEGVVVFGESKVCSVADGVVLVVVILWGCSSSLAMYHTSSSSCFELGSWLSLAI